MLAILSKLKFICFIIVKLSFIKNIRFIHANLNVKGLGPLTLLTVIALGPWPRANNTDQHKPIILGLAQYYYSLQF